MENSIAQFEVVETLLISKKICFVGSLLEGNFDVGDFIVFEKDEDMFKREILSLGTISNLERKLIYSLRIKCENKIEKENFHNWNPNSVITNIISK